MRTLDASLKKVDTNLHELVTKVVDIPLFEFVKAGIPWLLPHRMEKMPAGFTWAADNLVPHLRKELGSPAFEGIFERWKDDEKKSKDPSKPQTDTPALYDLGIQPFDWGVDQIVNKALSGARFLVFDEKDSPGLVIAQMEDWAIKEGLVLDDAIRASKVAALPRSLADRISGVVGPRKVLAMEWKREMPWVEVRYWHTPQKIETLKSCEGRLVFAPVKGHMREFCKVYVREGKVPDDGDIVNWDVIELAPVTFARPVPIEATYSVIPTVLSDMDELFIPRTHCFGKVTIGDLKPFLSKKINGSMNNSEEISQALGAYYRTIEQALVDNLEPPRTILTQETARDDIPETAFLASVQKTSAQVWEDGNDRSIWLLNLLCRVAVVMHTRHGTIFDANYKTPMFEPEQLIWSIIRSRERDTASYLKPMVLVAPVMRPKKDHDLKMPPKSGGPSNPLAGVQFNDLFR